MNLFENYRKTLETSELEKRITALEGAQKMNPKSRIERIETKVRVLSDEFELVSARTVALPFMPHQVGATRRERRRG